MTTSSVAVLTWYCIIADDRDFDTSTRNGLIYPSFGSLLKAYGIIAFQFDIHPMLLTIEVDMEEKHKISKAVTIGILGEIGIILRYL